MIDLNPTYDAKQYEKKWTKLWLENKYFHAEPDPTRKPYTVLMPPPNVTAQLHMGHGTGYTVQDLMIRWKRMLGYNACWLPGTDHAAIATQMMVEQHLISEGTSRAELGREAFFERCVAWKEKYGGIILDQIKQMGYSCDWDRVAYTMDPTLNEAVTHSFVDLYRKGLIYRGERLVNWDCELKTAISDDEVESVEQRGNLWYFRYPLEDGSGSVCIATTRPETMLGDTAVAVHPDDERYQALIGKKLRLPLTDRLIPIVADTYVKSEFGTGAVKITPAHDPNDFELGKRHNLPMINILELDGKLNANVPERFRGIDRFAARKEIIKELKAAGLFEKEEAHTLSIPMSDRSKSVIEPKLSMQWFLSMGDMAKSAAEVVRDGRIRLHPASWEKTYAYWLDNIRDWCISRQLWWGHRIPVWYCGSCQHANVFHKAPSACEKCGGSELTQDDDVLDTWFSSWLWPLSTFGWPDPEAEKRLGLDYFFPSDLLVTGPDIIFLWVARMVMAGLEFKGDVPFRDVYFNAIVCDKQGRKFSKTLGNGIDPLELIEAHGADAVRFTVGIIAPLGGRIKMGKEDFEVGSRFVNKLWNSARLLFRSLSPETRFAPLSAAELPLPTKWLLTQLSSSIATINQRLDQFRIDEAVEQIYHMAWSHFCDWGLECLKIELDTGDEASKARALSAAAYAFEIILRAAHPIVPFVTEELWSKLPAHPDLARKDALCVSSYPDPQAIPSFPEEAAQWQTVQDIVNGIRSLRGQAQLAPRDQVRLELAAHGDLVPLIRANELWIKRLAGVSELVLVAENARPKLALVHVGRNFSAFLPVGDRLDPVAEHKRLSKEKERLDKILVGVDRRLADAKFLANATPDVVAGARAQKATLESQLASLVASLEALS